MDGRKNNSAKATEKINQKVCADETRKAVITIFRYGEIVICTFRQGRKTQVFSANLPALSDCNKPFDNKPADCFKIEDNTALFRPKYRRIATC